MVSGRPRDSDSKFSQALTDFGFTQSRSDYSLLNKGSGSSFVALLVYMEDIFLAVPPLTSFNLDDIFT